MPEYGDLPNKGQKEENRPQPGYDAFPGGKKATKSGSRPRSPKPQLLNNSRKQLQTKRNRPGRNWFQSGITVMARSSLKKLLNAFLIVALGTTPLN